MAELFYLAETLRVELGAGELEAEVVDHGFEEDEGFGEFEPDWLCDGFAFVACAAPAGEEEGVVVG